MRKATAEQNSPDAMKAIAATIAESAALTISCGALAPGSEAEPFYAYLDGLLPGRHLEEAKDPNVAGLMTKYSQRAIHEKLEKEIVRQADGRSIVWRVRPTDDFGRLCYGEGIRLRTFARGWFVKDEDTRQEMEKAMAEHRGRANVPFGKVQHTEEQIR